MSKITRSIVLITILGMTSHIFPVLKKPTAGNHIQGGCGFTVQKQNNKKLREKLYKKNQKMEQKKLLEIEKNIKKDEEFTCNDMVTVVLGACFFGITGWVLSASK